MQQFFFGPLHEAGFSLGAEGLHREGPGIVGKSPYHSLRLQEESKGATSIACYLLVAGLWH